jgi:hypothetical protein
MNLIASLLIAGNLTCPFTKLVLPSGETPNQLDYQVVCGAVVPSKK